MMMDVVTGIGINPQTVAEAGALTLAGVEIAKRWIPSLFPAGSSQVRSIILPVLTGIVASLIGGAPFALAGILNTALNVSLGAAGAGLAHDKIVNPILDPLLDKLPGQGQK